MNERRIIHRHPIYDRFGLQKASHSYHYMWERLNNHAIDRYATSEINLIYLIIFKIKARRAVARARILLIIPLNNVRAFHENNR